MTTTIDKAGRLVLPKAIRERLHLVSGSEIDLIVENDSLRLIPHTPSAHLQNKDGLLVFCSTSAASADFDIADFVNQQRAAASAAVVG
jgi:AbrB family looped-hinge helix DNA binding protein